MASLLNKIVGVGKSSETAAPSGDSDFASFADAPDPSPTPSPLTALSQTLASSSSTTQTPAPYTAWYNVHERYSLSDFSAEGAVIAVAALVFALHFLGARLNRSKARAWSRAHSAPLRREFALVGFGSEPTAADADGAPELPLKEKSLFEFATYATGRQNAAFVDVNLSMAKRFNVVMVLVEAVLGYLFDWYDAPADAMEAICYPFDGKESLTVPSMPGAAEVRAKDARSSYDGFVFAVVNKTRMARLRDERYDVSITATKDHPRLPHWLSVMTESNEIAEAMLTPELVAAVEKAGDALEYLIISDQPTVKPTTLDEVSPRKRLFLRYRLPSSDDYAGLLPLFGYFLRLPDLLVQSARFRPEVTKKIRAVREDLVAQMKKASEAERAEERALEKEKAKKAKRDQELGALDAKAQKKYLDKERERELRKMQKKGSIRG